MSRLHKKCLTASLGTHGFLLLLLLFGSAFFMEKEKPIIVPTSTLKVVPSILVDSALSGGGGNPQVKPSEDREKGETLTPQPPAPKPPEPKKPDPPKPEIKKPEPLKPTPPKPPEPKKPDPPKPEVKKPEPLKLTRVKSNELKEFVKPATPSKPDTSARERAQEVSKIMSTLKGGFKDGTAIEVHGSGGPAYANYDQFVYEVYKSQWRPPAQLDDAGPTARLKVVIRRDGSVKLAEVVRGSGNRELDRSVEDLARRVKFVREFPDGAKDLERTYYINFNLFFKTTG